MKVSDLFVYLDTPMEFDWAFLSHLPYLGIRIGPTFVSAVSVFHAIRICLALHDQSILFSSVPKAWVSLLILSFGGSSVASILLSKPAPFLLQHEPMVVYSLVFLCMRLFPGLHGFFRRPGAQFVLHLSDGVLRTHAGVSFLTRDLPLASKLVTSSLAACGGGLVHRVLMQVHDSYADFYFGVAVAVLHVLLSEHLGVDLPLVVSACTLANIVFLTWMALPTFDVAAKPKARRRSSSLSSMKGSEKLATLRNKPKQDAADSVAAEEEDIVDDMDAFEDGNESNVSRRRSSRYRPRKSAAMKSHQA